MAPSYCWGGVESARAERANISHLFEAGCLLGDAATLDMPKPVRDAMSFTGWLGIGYLCCDRLCIVQDDGDAKMDQVKQMGEIYARSYCIIIAYESPSADASLHSPSMLSGVSGGSDPTTSTVWRSRGGRSRRAILPAQDQEYNYDDLDSNNAIFYPSKSLLRTGGLRHPRYPNFEFYAELVTNYSRREFSASQDAIETLFGLESVIGPAYPGGFIGLLPLATLLVAYNPY
ncbi:hypothetical protein EDB81DRAFT_913614 [Dactylonectria macrodidyma]|uniref:Heterokaryon incompatibility domain-containing protein n=1 Tax=Dactylonectria macrodidyma TaxID=307937 RepID=A0A9P9IIK4_9HYPO|nr:hypothetical protein EDB81DRAFT_913614 [Dactylonectria macrodidyma]